MAFFFCVKIYKNKKQLDLIERLLIKNYQKFRVIFDFVFENVDNFVKKITKKFFDFKKYLKYFFSV